MSETELSPTPQTDALPPLLINLKRVGGYVFSRLLTLVFALVVGVFLTIWVANLGGYLDTVVRANIDESLGSMVQGGWLSDVTNDVERQAIIEQTRAAMEEAAGLNQPFLLRCVQWLWKGLTLDWGTTRPYYTMAQGSQRITVRSAILDALPRTLLVFGSANVLLFLVSIFFALRLARRHGAWQDRLVSALAPLAAAPSWVYGIVLSLILMYVFHIYLKPFNQWPPITDWKYTGVYLSYLLPPIVAIFVSKFFQSIYAWRTVFLVNSSEEYVQIGVAKGLSDQQLERRYLLRPMLPNVLTSFALMLLGLWQEVVVLEIVFNVGGVGQMMFTAVRFFDVRLLVALVVTFAYLLVVTVFLLDIVYVLVDPRVKISGLRSSLSSPKRPVRLRALLRPAQSLPRLTLPPLTASDKQTVLRRVKTGGERRLYLGEVLRFLRQYPGVLFGSLIILALMVVSVYTLVQMPYQEALRRWRGDHFVWLRNPVNALPTWVNWFRKDDLPESIEIRADDPIIGRQETVVSGNTRQIRFSFPFDYPYQHLPTDLIVFFTARYPEDQKPLVSMTWVTPDGRELNIGSFSITSSYSYYMFNDDRLERRLKVPFVREGLFFAPGTREVLPGRYELQVTAFVFDPQSDVQADFVLYGQVWGAAGTDGQRRDVGFALLWGTPVALAFGLLAAALSTLMTLTIAAIGSWYGGWVDELIQRLTEINMILPFFPVSLLIYTLYSKSFWVILGVTVLLSVFGPGIKSFRSLFLQIKEMPYLEAAQSYGAGDGRIIFRYLIPRIGAIIVPQVVVLVPSYVFLEASLSMLGLYDPLSPPTWGQLVLQGLDTGFSQGAYHLLLLPAALLLLTGYAFLLLGFSLERVFEPRLRQE